MKILQWNLSRSTFVVWEMKRNVSVVCLIVATRSSGPPASQPVSCLTRLSADLSLIWLRVPTQYGCCSWVLVYKVWSTSSETDFFAWLWVHFRTPLFAGWCPRTPSLPGKRDGPSAPLRPLWASVKESSVPAPCYCSCRVGYRKSKSSTCASSFVWNWEEMVWRHLKCWELPSLSSVWAVFAFSNGTRD